MRKALCVCRSAIEMLEAELKDNDSALNALLPENALLSQSQAPAIVCFSKQDTNIELEGGEGNKLGHDKAETQVKAPAVGSHVASGIATIDSPLHGYTPLVENIERVRENKLGYENTVSQEKAVSLVATSWLEADDASPTDSFGLGKNKFPILPERSDLATSSSFFSKPMQKHDVNSTVGKKDQSEGSASKQESSRAPTITETMKTLDAMDVKIGD